MLAHRLLLGPVLIVLVALGCWLDDALDRVASPIPDLTGPTLPPGMLGDPVVCVIAGLAARELARILRESRIEASTTLTVGLAVIGVLLVGTAPPKQDAFTGAAVISTAVALALVGSLGYYARHRRIEGLVAAGGGALLAMGYLGLLLGFLPAINREHSAWILLWVLLSTKASDVGAFFAGRSLGRHKMVVWLSPGKTWEGFAGGVVLAALTAATGAAVLSATLNEPVPGLVQGLVSGALFAVVGQIGDLLASLLKRDAGRKDAGGTLPGFGGVIDVVDSLLLVGPVAFWLLRVFPAG